MDENRDEPNPCNRGDRSYETRIQWEIPDLPHAGALRPNVVGLLLTWYVSKAIVPMPTSHVCR